MDRPLWCVLTRYLLLRIHSVPSALKVDDFHVPFRLLFALRRPARRCPFHDHTALYNAVVSHIQTQPVSSAPAQLPAVSLELVPMSRGCGTPTHMGLPVHAPSPNRPPRSTPTPGCTTIIVTHERTGIVESVGPEHDQSGSNPTSRGSRGGALAGSCGHADPQGGPAKPRPPEAPLGPRLVPFDRSVSTPGS